MNLKIIKQKNKMTKKKENKIETTYEETIKEVGIKINNKENYFVKIFENDIEIKDEFQRELKSKTKLFKEIENYILTNH